MSEDLYSKVEEYSQLIFLKDTIEMDKQTKIDRVITPEIKAILADIDAEFEPYLTKVQQDMTALEADLKSQVVEAGRTVKGTYHQFVYSKPRVSWDTKALDGYAAGHPEIIQFRTEGSPSVSVRKV